MFPLICASDRQASRSSNRWVSGIFFGDTFSGPNSSNEYQYRRRRENGLITMTTRPSRPPRPSLCKFGNMVATTTRMCYAYNAQNHSRGAGSVRRPTRLPGRVDSAKAEELVAGLGFDVAGSASSSPSPPSSSSYSSCLLYTSPSPRD